MNRRSQLMMVSFVLGSLALAGCSRECAQPGSTISVHTAARTPNKGPAADGVFVVNGAGFAPNKKIRITVAGLPYANASSSAWHSRLNTSPITDANGSFSFSTEIAATALPYASPSTHVATFPPLDYTADPAGDITVTAKQYWSPCSATTTIKTAAVLQPVYEGGMASAVVDSTK